MSTPKPENQTAPQIHKRGITAAQSKGSLSKSTLLSFLIEWYRFAGIPYDAVDCDAVHHTLADRYPDRTNAFDATSRDEFWKLINQLPDAPAFIWDFPAQFTPDFLAYADQFGMVEALTNAKARLTMFLFAADDLDASYSAAQLVNHFDRQVDWVLVTNPANFKSVEFRKTGLYDLLTERKAPEIDMPHITTGSKNAWAEIENEEQRPLCIGEVIKRPALPFVARRELSGVLDRMFVQFEDIAPFLVPDASLIKNRCTRVKVEAKRPVSRFQNPLLSKK
jgi:hypothetical protein